MKIKQIFINIMVMLLSLNITSHSSLVARTSRIALSGIFIPQKATDCVLYQRLGPLAVLTINKPLKLNVLDMPTVRTIDQYLMAAEHDKQVSAILITSALHPTKDIRPFCAGGDIVGLMQDITSMTPFKSKQFLSREYLMNHHIACTDKPVIALADGLCLGGGLGLFGIAHHRIATLRSTFGAPELSLGLTPDVGIRGILTQGDMAIAQRMIYTGDSITATQAQRDLELVDHILPSDFPVDEFIASLAGILKAKMRSSFNFSFNSPYHSYSHRTIDKALDEAFLYLLGSSILPCVDKDSALSPWELPLDAPDADLIRAIDQSKISAVAALVTKRQFLSAIKLMIDLDRFTAMEYIRTDDYKVFLNMLRTDDFSRYVISKFIKKQKDHPGWDLVVDPDDPAQVSKAARIAESMLCADPRDMDATMALAGSLCSMTQYYSPDCAPRV